MIPPTDHEWGGGFNPPSLPPGRNPDIYNKWPPLSSLLELALTKEQGKCYFSGVAGMEIPENMTM